MQTLDQYRNVVVETWVEVNQQERVTAQLSVAPQCLPCNRAHILAIVHVRIQQSQRVHTAAYIRVLHV